MDLKEIDIANQNSNRHPWEQARVKVIRSLLNRIIDADKELLVLDIGSGDMYVAGELLNQYPKAEFICIDTGYGQMGIQSNNSLTTFSTLDEFKRSTNKKVDVVLLLDVIEHIDNETGFLQNLLKEEYITPETSFVITVPAFQSLFSAHDRYLGHYRRYTIYSLQDRLNNAGLTTVKSNYFFFSLLLPRKWQQRRENTNETAFKGLGQWRGGNFVTTIVKTILFIDFKIGQLVSMIGIKLPGLSLYCICRKPA